MSPPDSSSILTHRLAEVPRRIVACSGGVDSLLLADVAHSLAPESTIVAHSITPAVPEAATRRVRAAASDLGWRLEEISSAEFDDARYLTNPVDRCYFCKTNLYDELDRVSAALAGDTDHGWTVLSGANVDDLGEFRPGLAAAGEHGVRHPYVEARWGKEAIRALARSRGRVWHDVPAAPCLASRLYTGTPVTPSLVRAIDRGEELIRSRLRIAVVRCRVSGTEVRVELADTERHRISDAILEEVFQTMSEIAPGLTTIVLDELPYRPGRSFVRIESDQ